MFIYSCLHVRVQGPLGSGQKLNISCGNIRKWSKNTFFSISQGREWCGSLRWSGKNYGVKKLKKIGEEKFNERKILKIIEKKSNF